MKRFLMVALFSAVCWTAYPVDDVTTTTALNDPWFVSLSDITYTLNAAKAHLEASATAIAKLREENELLTDQNTTLRNALQLREFWVHGTNSMGQPVPAALLPGQAYMFRHGQQVAQTNLAANAAIQKLGEQLNLLANRDWIADILASGGFQ